MLESERSTRAGRIDPKLRAQGWEVVPYEEAKPLTAYDRCAIKEFPTANGPVDYALCVDSRILGLVEAKKLTLGPQNVLTQAERYAKGLAESAFNFQGLRAPFLLFHERRNHLAPRRPSSTQPLPYDCELSHPGCPYRAD